MRHVLPLLLLGLLTACASSRQVAYAPDEKITDVPDALRAAFAGAGRPNFASATEVQLWGSRWVRVGAGTIDQADRGMAIISVHYTSARQDEKSGRVEPARCANSPGVVNWTNTEVMLGGGLFRAGELDTFPCSASRRRTSDVENLSGHLFPLAIGNRLSFEVRGKVAYGNKNSAWPHGRRYTYEVIGKQDGFQNGYLSIPGDVYRIRITMQNLHNRGASTGTVLWSDALKWVVSRSKAQWDPTLANAWPTELAAVAGAQPIRVARGQEQNVVPLSDKTSYTREELWQIAVDALTGEAMKRQRAELRAAEEEARARVARGETRSSQQESAAQFLGFASALAGGMMAAEGARTGNAAMMNQGSEVLVRGGVVAATGEREDLGELTQSLTNAAGKPASGAATAGVAPPTNAAAAQQIASACNSHCSDLTSQCRNQTQGRNQEPCYRAAACQCQCFLKHAPDSPNAGQWRQCVADNSANAERLRSNATVFDPNRR
jgi:hypothetical protein